MCTSVFSKKVSSNQVETNISQGSYRPFFFDLPDYNISRVEFNSCFFNNSEIERQLLQGGFSFAYLREDKLRTIDAFNNENDHVTFNDFLNHFGIQIKSKNLFKTGKYLSRVLRPIRYGSFYNRLDVHINNNHNGKITDGISIISVDLAKSLGWDDAKPNMSAQFTLFYNGGLVKGHCILSSWVHHDVIIYGNDNIKTEISLNNGYEYVTLEPVKIGESLRMDIQSMLNLWGLFGGEQYLSWAYTGMQQFKEDLFAGNLSSWLDNFDEIEKEEYDNEQWTLRKAIWAKIDYTKYPGLIRSAWSMMKNSILRYADNIHGNPAFRIPILEGKRAYIRVDLRDHDEEGNFSSTVDQGTVELDGFGNLWIHENDIIPFMAVKGGADQDDSVAIIPIEGSRAVIFRNPNQFSEYGIHKIISNDVELKHVNKIVGEIPIKQIKEEEKDLSREVFPTTGNSLLDSFMRTKENVESYIVEYNLPNLIRTYTKICENTASIGVAANAEMIRSAIGITKPKMLNKLMKMFNWNLEKIIDSTVKDGIDAKEDMEAVYDLFQHVVENKVKVPKSLINRFPEKMRELVAVDTKHPMDELLEAIKILIDRIDLEILGRGSASRGNRIPGLIDRIQTPIVELGLTSIDNPMFDMALGLLKGYNRSIAIMLESTKDLENVELARKEKIDAIQTDFLRKLDDFSKNERSLIVNVFAYEIYKGSSSVHDSILWIGSKGDLTGTAADMIEMLANSGLAYHVKKNGSVKRYSELKQAFTELKEIRVWSKEDLRPEIFLGINEILAENKQVLLGDTLLNLGDECQLQEGSYNIKTIVQSISRKDRNRILKNSLTIYLS